MFDPAHVIHQGPTLAAAAGNEVAIFGFADQVMDGSLAFVNLARMVHLALVQERRADGTLVLYLETGHVVELRGDLANSAILPGTELPPIPEAAD